MKVQINPLLSHNNQQPLGYSEKKMDLFGWERQNFPVDTQKMTIPTQNQMNNLQELICFYSRLSNKRDEWNKYNGKKTLQNFVPKIISPTTNFKF